jgi:DNA-binding HxlR family transcriptional regulator
MTDIDEITAIKSCDLWIGLRKFANRDVSLIAKVLFEGGPLTFSDLTGKTDLSKNVLNHDLIEMRKAEIIKKVDRVYCLTVYGALLFESLAELTQNMIVTPGETLFTAFEHIKQERGAGNSKEKMLAV